MTVAAIGESEREALALLGGEVHLPLSFVLDQAYLRQGDAAFMGGSLIEGTGNRYSDIDVHVVTPALRIEREIDLRSHYRVLSRDRSILRGTTPESDVFLIHTVIPGTAVKVDIEYRTADEIERLIAEVRNIFDYARKALVLLTKTMPVRDMAFIHRLYNSTDIFGAGRLATLRSEIGIHRFAYLMYRWKASDFSVLLDLLGAWEQGELVRSVDMARENLVSQFQAYTHLCGNTNYHRKWILPSADKLALDQDLRRRFTDLLLAGPLACDEDRRAFILATLDFVDELFALEGRILASNHRYPSGREACALLDAHFREEAGDYSDMEIAYRKKAYGVPGLPTRAWFEARP